ncbi:MAG: COX15/CtaA family protein [Rhodospirillales bacterium]|nr:COX15/CtaA family protein [Rhodospirillales bacterium]
MPPTAFHPNRPVALWLLAMAAMVFVMVVLGGLTRLTHSGLSMVEWQPLIGALPPLSEAEWTIFFEKYKQFPEYQKLNAHMTLAEFKGIFWLEYFHRLWGRAMGLVFLLPFLWFLVKGRIDRALAPRVALIFVLGGLQGVLGWFMVKSGLVDRPDVSQYRLTAHLGAAFLIQAALIWVALSLLYPRTVFTHPERALALRRWLIGLMTMIVITVLAGGFVAGTDAGFKFNTFPLMDGRLVPTHFLFPESPWYVNLFEDEATIQFNHRVLAIVTVIVAFVAWMKSRSAALPARAHRACDALGLMALVQVGLGIATLLLIVPVWLGSLHQAGALVLFTLALWALHELRPYPANG